MSPDFLRVLLAWGARCPHPINVSYDLVLITKVVIMCTLNSYFSYTTDGGALGNLKNGSIPQDDVFAGKNMITELCYDIDYLLPSVTVNNYVSLICWHA